MSDDGVLIREKLEKARMKLEQEFEYGKYEASFPCPKCGVRLSAFIVDHEEAEIEPCLKCKMGDMCD